MQSPVPALLASRLAFTLAAVFAVFALQQGIASQTPPKPRLPVKSGRITLPPAVEPPAVDQRPARPQSRDDLDQFYRDVIDLRRSKVLSPKDEEALLRGLEVRYDDPAGMAVKLSLRCRNDLLHGLMKVIDRYGRKYHVEELHFQVLSRPLGQVSSRVIKSIVDKAGDSAKTKLLDYLVCKFAPARNAAADLLPEFLTAADVPILIQVSKSRKTDIRRKVLELLAGLDDPRVRSRIGEILSSDPGLAGAACEAAIAQGESMVESLRKLVERPARGRDFGYACFALVRLEGTLGHDLLTREMVPHLRAALADDDPFLRATSAVALGAIAYRTTDWLERGRYDKKIVDALLTLVAPTKFIQSLRLIKPTANEVLVNFTGRDFFAQRSAWTGWWEEARVNFVGLRRRVALTDANAARALLLWNAGPHFLALRGPQVADDRLPKDATPFFVDAATLQTLVRELGKLGFMASARLPGVPDVWTLDLQADDARVMMRVAASKEANDLGARIHGTIADLARTQVWQKHRDPERHPDAAAFWRAEEKWLAAHPGKGPQRLVELIVQRLPKLDHAGRRDALDDLQAVAGLPRLIQELQGADLVKVAKAQAELDGSDFRLLEIALLAPGDTVWRQALGVLEGRVKGAGDKLASRLFRLLGPDRVLIAIRHPSPPIAVAAMHDAAANSNRAAVPVLLERIKDPDGQVQRTAIYALGRLNAVDARAALVDYEPKAHPVIRREIWGALGRIDGEQVPGILKRAMQNPAVVDRLAVLSAMGHTRSPELARFLAARFVAGDAGAAELVDRSELALRSMGAILTIPALRQHLQMQEGPERHRLVLLLGDLQDTMVVQDLIDLLRHPKHELVAGQLLEEITGRELRDINNRNRVMQVWYATEKNHGQGQWFLSALKVARVPTTLRPEDLMPRSGVGAVAELSRLVLQLESRHLRVMAATLLRETTGVEFARSNVRFAEEASLQAIVDRYRIHAETSRAAAK